MNCSTKESIEVIVVHNVCLDDKVDSTIYVMKFWII